MKVSFHQLYSHFSSKIINSYFHEFIISEYRDIKLITKNQNSFAEDVLYVGKTSALIENTRFIEKSNLMLINDNNLTITDFFVNCLNIIEIDCSEDLFEIFNQAKEIFSRDFEAMTNSAALLNSIIQGDGLDNIVKASSEILNNPIVIIDASYKILAHSQSLEITDPYWIENIKRGYCSYDFIAAVKKIKSIEYGQKTDRPFEVVCGGSPIKKLIYKIEVDNKHVGNVVALGCNKPFIESDNDILVLVSKVISEEMKKDTVYRNRRDVVYENFLLDFLERKITSKERAKERIKSAGINIGKNLAVFALDISKYNSKGKNLNYLTDSIHSLFSVKGSVYFNDYIVILYSTNSESLMEILGSTDIKEFLRSNDLVLGVSREFSDIVECRKYYDQAVKALKFNNILEFKSNIALYRQFQFYDLISLTSNMVNYREFCHPVLFKLKEYDRRNKSEFYHTLFVYLKNNQNLQASSKELFIHRNTMKYRVNKIVELTKLDFSNNEDVFEVYLSYKVMNYLDKTNKNDLLIIKEVSE